MLKSFWILEAAANGMRKLVVAECELWFVWGGGHAHSANRQQLFGCRMKQANWEL